jgi:hypothetical protein
METIEFLGYDGKSRVTIIVSKILGIATRADPEDTSIFVACEKESDEWVVHEKYDVVLAKLRLFEEVAND